MLDASPYFWYTSNNFGAEVITRTLSKAAGDLCEIAVAVLAVLAVRTLKAIGIRTLRGFYRIFAFAVWCSVLVSIYDHHTRCDAP